MRRQDEIGTGCFDLMQSQSTEKYQGETGVEVAGRDNHGSKVGVIKKHQDIFHDFLWKQEKALCMVTFRC